MKRTAVKYKVGDEVKVKTWEEMKNKYGTNSNGNICPEIKGYEYYDIFTKGMEKVIENFSDRIVKIQIKYDEYYLIKGSTKRYEDYMFEDIKEYNPIKSRFEILDL